MVGDDAHVLDPMSVDWHAVAAGRVQVKLRQRPGPANSMGRMKFMFPNAAGNLAARHAGEREDRGCGPAAEQRLRPA